MSDAGLADTSGIGDTAEVTLNDAPIETLAEGAEVKGPADHDTFEVHPNLVNQGDDVPDEPEANA